MAYSGVKTVQHGGKGGIAAGIAIALAAVIPPDGSAPWEIALYTGVAVGVLNALKHGLRIQIPGLDT